MFYCGNCDGCELYGCSYYCEAERNKPPTQMEKLRAILNQGIEYIFKKALVNFSNRKTSAAEDEFSVEITDPYDGCICIVCSEILSICNCYVRNEKTYFTEDTEMYGYFIDFQDMEKYENYTLLTESVNMKTSVRNVKY
jgi:hypothetical protein